MNVFQLFLMVNLAELKHQPRELSEFKKNPEDFFSVNIICNRVFSIE